MRLMRWLMAINNRMLRHGNCNTWQAIGSLAVAAVVYSPHASDFSATYIRRVFNGTNKLITTDRQQELMMIPMI